MTIDYHTLLTHLIDERYHGHSPHIRATDLLATRIPDLCPDCKGLGSIASPTTARRGGAGGMTVTHHTCDHPNVPTIADLLRWGENVANARVRADHLGYVQWVESCVHVGDCCFDADDVGLLAALRTEEA